MAKIVATGDITSWDGSGTLENHIIATGCAPYQYTLTQTTGASDATAFSASGVIATSMSPGLRSWSGSFSGRYRKAAALTGTTAAVAAFTGSDTNAYPAARVYGYTLSLTAPAYDVTELSTSGVTDAAYTPGLWSWSVTMQAFLDDGAALPNTDAADAWTTTPSALSLKLSEEGGTDNTIGGVGIITTYEYGHAIGNVATVNIVFTGKGNMTGAGTTNIVPSGALVRPVADTLLLRMSNGASDLESSGEAFLTGLTLSVPGPGAQIDVSGTFQGTGALTNALTLD